MARSSARTQIIAMPEWSSVLHPAQETLRSLWASPEAAAVAGLCEAWAGSDAAIDMLAGASAAAVPCRFSVCIASRPTITAATSRTPSTTPRKTL